MTTVSGSTTEEWVRRYHPDASGATQLVCLPHAGGSASFYFPLSRLLTPAVEAVSIQYPGRHDRRAEPAISDLVELAEHVFAAVRDIGDRKVALFGHSMGAIVAYEVALRLEQVGITPVRLFVSGRRAPSRYRTELVHQRDDAGVLRELARLRGTNAAVLDDPELIEMIMPALRSDYRAVETYRHEPGQLLDCPVTVLIGDNDPRTSMEEALAWEEHTAGAFEVRVFTGGHFFLNAHLPQIAGLIRTAVD